MDPRVIAELRGLLAKATPRPWRKASGQNWASIAVIPHSLIGTAGALELGTRLRDVDSVGRLMGVNHEADAALIVAAINALPALLDAAAESATLREQFTTADRLHWETEAELDEAKRLVAAARMLEPQLERAQARARELESESAILRAELDRAHAAHAEQVDEEARLRARVEELSRLLDLATMQGCDGGCTEARPCWRCDAVAALKAGRDAG